MITEHDLTQALGQIADEDAQAREFRHRIDVAVTDRPQRSALRRFAPALAIAASVVVIAAVALALTVLPSHGHRATHQPPTHRNQNIVATFTGIGNATRDVPAATAPADRQTTLEISCNGPGRLRVNDYYVRSCSGGASGGLGDGGRTTPKQLTIAARSTVTWRVVVRFTINYRTNGIVERPVDPLLNSAYSLAHAAGSGTQKVHIGATAPTAVRVIVACTGSGVRLSSSDHRFNGQYTHTCEPNASYAFDIAHIGRPTDFIVTASATTTWHLVVIGQ